MPFSWAKSRTRRSIMGETVPVIDGRTRFCGLSLLRGRAITGSFTLTLPVCHAYSGVG